MTQFGKKKFVKKKTNLMGVSKAFFNPKHYCNLFSENSKIISMKDKQFAPKILDILSVWLI